MTITTRTGKGAPLSWAEADSNFSDLDQRTRLGWRDNIVSLDVQVGNPDAPALNLFRDGLHAYNFFAGQLSEAFASFHIDHDYALGTALYPHVHWSLNTPTSGVIRWGVEYTIAKGHGQGTFGPTTTVYVEQTSDGTAYKHYVAEVSDANAIPGTGIEPDTLILCRFFRDGTHANDTLAADAFVFCVDLHYQADKATTPYKRPNFMTGV
jgi:hypothetical protein